MRLPQPSTRRLRRWAVKGFENWLISNRSVGSQAGPRIVNPSKICSAGTAIGPPALFRSDDFAVSRGLASPSGAAGLTDAASKVSGFAADGIRAA
jgi:hypothetical protein